MLVFYDAGYVADMDLIFGNVFDNPTPYVDPCPREPFITVWEAGQGGGHWFKQRAV